jgi:hypothetical protein
MVGSVGKQPLNVGMGSQRGQPAMGEHPHVGLSATGDFSDLSMAEACAPEVECFSLGYRQMSQKPRHQISQVVLFSQISRVGLTAVGGECRQS